MGVTFTFGKDEISLSLRRGTRREKSSKFESIKTKREIIIITEVIIIIMCCVLCLNTSQGFYFIPLWIYTLSLTFWHSLVQKVKCLRQKNSSFVFVFFDVVRLNSMHFSHQLRNRCQSPPAILCGCDGFKQIRNNGRVKELSGKDKHQRLDETIDMNKPTAEIASHRNNDCSDVNPRALVVLIRFTFCYYKSLRFILCISIFHSFHFGGNIFHFGFLGKI